MGAVFPAWGLDPTFAERLVEAWAVLLTVFYIECELLHAVRHHRAELFEVRVQAEADAAQREERDHDLRSALLALEGAAHTLERHQEALGGGREALVRALAAEVVRLQHLLQPLPARPDEAFDVGLALEPLATRERARGVDLHAALPMGVRVMGSSTATVRVVGNLLDNARRHAPGAPVRLTAERQDEWIVIRVEDDGPGIPPGDRQRVFERGGRSAREGLGLSIAARLMREQRGDLWLEPSEEGARFALCIPVASEDDGGAPGHEDRLLVGAHAT
jgi:two-component system OmpR family sensor kinase